VRRKESESESKKKRKRTNSKLLQADNSMRGGQLGLFLNAVMAETKAWERGNISRM